MTQSSTGAVWDRRCLAASGLLFVGAWIVGLLVISPPAATASTADLVAYYRANTAMVIVQTYLTSGLTGIVLMVFVSALRSLLRGTDSGSSTLSGILLGSGTVVVGLSCVEALFVTVLASVTAATSDPAIFRTLLELNVEIDVFKLPMLAMMIGAASMMASRANALPTWLIWAGVLEVGLLVAASVSALFPSEVLDRSPVFVGRWLTSLDCKCKCCCCWLARSSRKVGCGRHRTTAGIVGPDSGSRQAEVPSTSPHDVLVAHLVRTRARYS